MTHDYFLSDFRYHKTVQDTSETLLKLICKLVFNGDITKVSHTSPVYSATCQKWLRQQTKSKTLVLALTLHHETGRSKLIRILHEHGITSSYDEVIRFCKSAARFAPKNHATYQNLLGLTTEIGPIFAWCNNYDLWISSPNGTKTTHAMVSEFTIHPERIIDANC